MFKDEKGVFLMFPQIRLSEILPYVIAVVIWFSSLFFAILFGLILYDMRQDIQSGNICISDKCYEVRERK